MRTGANIESQRRGRGLALLAVLVACLLRAPFLVPMERDSRPDEVGYLKDGLLLFEGLPPAYKFAPDALGTWLVAIDAAVHMLPELVRETSVGAPLSTAVMSAGDRTLFHLYDNMEELRRLVAGASALLSLAAVAAMAAAGFRRGGLPSAIAGGAIAAGMPIFCELSGDARPYCAAWSLALLALCATSTRARPFVSGALLGAGVACRVEMILVAPLVCWDLGRFPLRRWALEFAASLAATFLLLAPWYPASLLGNLRVIASVRHLAARGGSPSWLVAELLAQGLIGAALLLPALGIDEVAPGVRIAVLATIASCAAIAMSPDPGGARHLGPLFVALAWSAPIAIASPGIRSRADLSSWATALVALPVLWQAARHAVTAPRTTGFTRAAEWVESHIPAGSAVFLVEEASTLLPTAEASQRIWEDVSRSDAWARKLERSKQVHGFDLAVEPVFLSEDSLNQDRGLMRRFLVLGQPYEAGRKRYDVHLVGAGVFLEDPGQATRTLCSTGGVLISRNEAPGFGAPAAGFGSDLRVYVLPEQARAPACADLVREGGFGSPGMPAGR